MEKNQTTCLWCGKFVAVKTNGCMASHRAAGGGKCEGSGKPDEISRTPKQPAKKGSTGSRC